MLTLGKCCFFKSLSAVFSVNNLWIGSLSGAFTGCWNLASTMGKLNKGDRGQGISCKDVMDSHGGNNLSKYGHYGTAER